MDSCHVHVDVSSLTHSHCGDAAAHDAGPSMILDGTHQPGERRVLKGYPYAGLAITVVLIAATLWDAVFH